MKIPFDIKFRPQIESEEDKNRFNNLCSVIDESEHWNDVSKQAFKDWLKSLRPQPHWKPSKKQMEALEDAFRKDGGNEYRKVINSLYCDLQKLL